MNASELREWRSAALAFGELLTSVGPNGYYEFTAEQWAVWAKSTIEQVRAETIEQCVAMVREYDDQNECGDVLKELAVNMSALAQATKLREGR